MKLECENLEPNSKKMNIREWLQTSTWTLDTTRRKARKYPYFQNVKFNTIKKPSKLKLTIRLYYWTVKTLQGQLVAIINIVATVGGAFVFAYKAVEYSLDEPDINKVNLSLISVDYIYQNSKNDFNI